MSKAQQPLGSRTAPNSTFRPFEFSRTFSDYLADVLAANPDLYHDNALLRFTVADGEPLCQTVGTVLSTDVLFEGVYTDIFRHSDDLISYERLRLSTPFEAKDAIKHAPNETYSTWVPFAASSDKNGYWRVEADQQKVETLIGYLLELGYNVGGPAKVLARALDAVELSVSEPSETSPSTTSHPTSPPTTDAPATPGGATASPDLDDGANGSDYLVPLSEDSESTVDADTDTDTCSDSSHSHPGGITEVDGEFFCPAADCAYHGGFREVRSHIGGKCNGGDPDHLDLGFSL